jgi:hypothetical protein
MRRQIKGQGKTLCFESPAFVWEVSDMGGATKSLSMYGGDFRNLTSVPISPDDEMEVLQPWGATMPLQYALSFKDVPMSLPQSVYVLGNSLDVLTCSNGNEAVGVTVERVTVLVHSTANDKTSWFFPIYRDAPSAAVLLRKCGVNKIDVYYKHGPLSPGFGTVDLSATSGIRTFLLSLDPGLVTNQSLKQLGLGYMCVLDCLAADETRHRKLQPLDF